MGYERITDDKQFDGYVRDSHIYRYKVADKFIEPDDVVLDIACGSGYAKDLMKGKYIGVDKYNFCSNIVVDLNTWEANFDYDVAVCIETIEHLKDYTQLVKNLTEAKKRFVISTPIVPTKHRNEFHLHDFTMSELKTMFKAYKLIHSEVQDDLYGILVYETNSNNN